MEKEDICPECWDELENGSLVYYRGQCPKHINYSMPNQTNNEELYHQIERNLTNFKNLKITYTEFIDWTISKIQAAEKRGERKGLEKAKELLEEHYFDSLQHEKGMILFHTDAVIKKALNSL